jgi:hypothetical protein
MLLPPNSVSGRVNILAWEQIFLKMIGDEWPYSNTTAVRWLGDRYWDASFNPLTPLMNSVRAAIRRQVRLDLDDLAKEQQ